MTRRFRLLEQLLNRAHPANAPIPYVLATPAEAATAIEEARDKLATGTQAAVDREALRVAYTAAILAEYDHRAATRVAASPAEHAAAITDAVMTVRDHQLLAAETAVRDNRTALDGAYRERAQLLAWLATLHPTTTVIAPSMDVLEDGWQLLYLTVGGRQLTWHISPRDADLFAHVEHVPMSDPRAQWDGHTTEAKYERIGSHVSSLADGHTGPDEPVCVCTVDRSCPLHQETDRA